MKSWQRRDGCMPKVSTVPISMNGSSIHGRWNAHSKSGGYVVGNERHIHEHVPNMAPWIHEEQGCLITRTMSQCIQEAITSLAMLFILRRMWSGNQWELSRTVWGAEERMATLNNGQGCCHSQYRTSTPNTGRSAECQIATLNIGSSAEYWTGNPYSRLGMLNTGLRPL